MYIKLFVQRKPALILPHKMKSNVLSNYISPTTNSGSSIARGGDEKEIQPKPRKE